MKLVLQHLTGNANVKAAACGLAEAGLLAEFHVSIASFQGSVLNRVSAFSPFSEIRRRQFDTILKPFTHTWPWYEIGRILAIKSGLSSLTLNENGLFYIDKLSRNLDSRVANRLKVLVKRDVTGVYAYEDCAAFTFYACKKLGLQCLYDLPIGYWRTAHKLLEIEKQKWPQWTSTLTGFNDTPAKLARKDDELKLADHIFVASSFTASTLTDFPGKHAAVTVIPYGYPDVNKTTRDYSNISRKKKLRLLFVGSLSQRKGIANLFTAIENLIQYVELTLVGYKTTNDCTALNAALSKHNWIPTLPHHEILKLMRVNDVLLFPSLFEGFGLVITEAMSQGTPVITTERTAGPDLINHNETGWLINAGSTEELQNAIEVILNNPKQVAKVGKAAMETAEKRPWKVYGHELAQAVQKLL